MSLIGVLGVTYMQVNDDPPPPAPLSCSVVRGEVLDQAEQEPLSLEALYPSKSAEQQQCNINDFIRQLDKDTTG
jgi:hypothetical protein